MITTSNDNGGIVPPWLQTPAPPAIEPNPPSKHTLNVSLLRSERPITLRHGYIDAVLAAGAVS